MPKQIELRRANTAQTGINYYFGRVPASCLIERLKRGGKLKPDLNVCFAPIVLKKSEDKFCSKFPVAPDVGDAAMIQDVCRD